MNTIDVDFLLEIVLAKLIFSTIVSVTIALFVGGIIGAIVDFRRRKKYRSNNQPPPPRLIFFALLGSFIGTMLIAFLPIQIDRNSIDGGAYYAIWLYVQLITLTPIGSILGAILGCWIGTKWGSKFTRKNIAIAIGIVYLIMVIAIYGFLAPPTPQLSINTHPTAKNSLPIIAEISGYDNRSNFIKYLTFTPDSQGVAIVSKNNIRIFDLPSQQNKTTFKLSATTLKDMVGYLAFTSDGKKLITATPEQVQIRDIKTGEIQQILEAGHYIYPTLDAKKLVGMTAKNTYSNLLVWNLSDYKLLYTIRAKLTPWDSFINNSIGITPDSKTLIFAPNPGNSLLEVWNLDLGKKVKSFGSNDGKSISALAIAPDGKQLLEVHNQNLYLWDIDRRKIIRTISQVGTVRSVFYQPDGHTIVINTEKSLQLWDLTAAKPIKTIIDKIELTRYFAISPDGKLIAVSQNSQVKIFQLIP